MIDFHSHILPGIDDGSRNVDESLTLLSMLRQQGVSVTCATPHFYIEDNNVSQFLYKRQASYERLIYHPDYAGDAIKLGAEVRYFSGLSHLNDLDKLRLQGTKLLLIEMPFTKWSGFDLREIDEINSSYEFAVVFAHIERYLPFQSHDIIDRLLEKDILIQCNASFFANKSTRRKALKMLKNGQIHFIGSDCHSVDERPPRFTEFEYCVREKFGEPFLRAFEHESYALSEEFK